MTTRDYRAPQLNEDQRETLRKLVIEGVNSRVRQDAEKDLTKELRQRAKEELGVNTKLFNKVVEIAHKESGEQYDTETESVLLLAECVGIYHSDK